MTLFTQLAIAFLALAVVGYVSKILKSFKPPFYILAGIVLGPAVFGLVDNLQVFGLMGDFGLVFLLFYLGYEFSLNKLIKKKKLLGMAGILDFIINFSLALILAWVLKLSWFYAIVFAGMLYMSSSSIITKSLIQLGAVKEKEGEVIMGIMIFEDLVMIVFLVIVQSISQNQGFEWLMISQDIGLALVFAFVVLYFGKKYAPFIDKIINQRSHESAHLGFIAFVLTGVVLGMAFGVSKALTAFLLGLVVSETKNKDEMKGVILKFRDIFGSMFFFYFGMTFSFQSVTIPIYILAIIVLVAIVGKVISGYLMYLTQCCERIDGLFIGIASIPRGEFSLIIAGLVSTSKPEFAHIAVILILISSLVTTLIFFIINRLCHHQEICLLSEKFLEGSEV